jgi:hypothetical protein
MEWYEEEYCDYCGHLFVPGERLKLKSVVFPDVTYTLCPENCYEFTQEENSTREDYEELT